MRGTFCAKRVVNVTPEGNCASWPTVSIRLTSESAERGVERRLEEHGGRR